MNRPRIVFCYRYGLLGGVSAQLLNRFPYLSRDYHISLLYEQDYGMVSRFPAGVATVAGDVRQQEAALRAAKPDLVVVIDSPTFIEAWRNAGTPGKLVLEVHTTTANLSYLHDLDKSVGIAHIVTVSGYMEQLLRQQGVDAFAPVTVVPNCLAEAWRDLEPAAEPAGTAAGTPAEPAGTPAEPAGTAVRLDGKPVLWVGKLDSHKRWRTAVDLMDQLTEDPALDLVPILVGGLTSPESEVMAITTRLATSAGLARAVWWPRVEYDLMPGLYAEVGRAGGVLLCTSTNESFGMSVAESVVCGCPVVAPAVGALPELLPPQALYQPEDWAEARAKTRRALVDPDYRREILSSVDRIRELTDPRTAAESYRSVVAAVLKSSE